MALLIYYTFCAVLLAGVKMVKISIALPNNTEISLEAEDSDQLRPVVDLVRQDLLSDVARLDIPANGDAKSLQATAPPGSNQKSTSVPTGLTAPAKSPQPRRRSSTPPREARSPGPTPAESTPSASAPVQAVPPELSDPRLARDFAVFCRTADPMGDMRKVVAAAEGAHRHLNMDSVDAWELGYLFDLAGWTRPHNFTQTLRNAARNTFRWLERVPGRAGRYTTTEEGRSVVLNGTNLL